MLFKQDRELTDLRTYNSKTFGKPTGVRTVFVTVGHFHYFNKLGVGDGRVAFREIDNTLQWNEARRGWTFLFHNYQPFVPEFADDWFLYRDLFQGKDQITGFRARDAAHVAGRLVDSVPNVTSQNAVIYDDALGAGIDLIAAFTHKKMRKIVRIRDGFKPSVDTNFDFEMRYPDGVEVYECDPDTGILTQVDPMTPYVLKQRSQLFIGHDAADGEDWFTRINPVRAWDSGVAGNGTGQIVQIAPAAIAVANGRTFLRKRMTAAFFSASVGDVFTDATFSYTETKDTYYGTSFTTGGAPDAETLAIGGWGEFYYPYIEWVLTGTPVSADTFKAFVSLNISGLAVNDSTSTLRRVTSSWTEAGVTNAAHPTDTATGEVSLGNMMSYAPSALNPRIMVDWTQMYKDWKDGVNSNFGVKVHSAGNNNAQHNLCSSDNLNSNLQPLLIISYAPAVDGRSQLGSQIPPRAFAPRLAR